MGIFAFWTFWVYPFAANYIDKRDVRSEHHVYQYSLPQKCAFFSGMKRRLLSNIP
jgi:hypothetical protein